VARRFHSASGIRVPVGSHSPTARRSGRAHHDGHAAASHSLNLAAASGPASRPQLARPQRPPIIFEGVPLRWSGPMRPPQAHAWYELITAVRSQPPGCAA